MKPGPQRVPRVFGGRQAAHRTSAILLRLFFRPEQTPQPGEKPSIWLDLGGAACLVGHGDGSESLCDSRAAVSAHEPVRFVFPSAIETNFHRLL